jgi:hypothetical protein
MKDRIEQLEKELLEAKSVKKPLAGKKIEKK